MLQKIIAWQYGYSSCHILEPRFLSSVFCPDHWNFS